MALPECSQSHVALSCTSYFPPVVIWSLNEAQHATSPATTTTVLLVLLWVLWNKHLKHFLHFPANTHCNILLTHTGKKRQSFDIKAFSYWDEQRQNQIIVHANLEPLCSPWGAGTGPLLLLTAYCFSCYCFSQRLFFYSTEGNRREWFCNRLINVNLVSSAVIRLKL